MEHKIIKTDNYLLIVDDSEIKDYDWNNFNISDFYSQKDVLLAHIPLNGNSILDGVDLLPPLEHNEGIDLRPIEIKAKQHCKDNVFGEDRYYGYIDGYIQCIQDKEKYKYTEEDIRKAFDLLIENERLWDQFDIRIIKNKPKSVQDKVDEIIESLQQPKLPIGFKCEVESMVNVIMNGFEKLEQVGETFYEPKKVINSQGQTEWVGEYIFN